MFYKYYRPRIKMALMVLLRAEYARENTHLCRMIIKREKMLIFYVNVFLTRFYFYFLVLTDFWTA